MISTDYYLKTGINTKYALGLMSYEQTTELSGLTCFNAVCNPPIPLKNSNAVIFISEKQL